LRLLIVTVRAVASGVMPGHFRGGNSGRYAKKGGDHKAGAKGVHVGILLFNRSNIDRRAAWAHDSNHVRLAKFV